MPTVLHPQPGSVAIPSVRVSVFRLMPNGKGIWTAAGSQSPRFGSRCFVNKYYPALVPNKKGRGVAIPSVRVSVFRPASLRGPRLSSWCLAASSQSPRFGSRCFVLTAKVDGGTVVAFRVAIPSVRVSVFRPGY